jgi:hypothetical protein
MVGFAALAKSPAAAIVAQAAGPRLPSYVTREQARAMINAAETTTHRLHEPGDQLDEDAVDALLEYAEWLAAEEDDPLRGGDRRRRLRNARAGAPPDPPAQGRG